MGPKTVHKYNFDQAADTAGIRSRSFLANIYSKQTVSV